MLEVHQKMSPLVNSNDAPVAFTLFGGVVIDVTNQHAFGSLHQGMAANQFTRTNGKNAGLVHHGFKISRTATLCQLDKMPQIQIWQHLLGALLEVMTDDGQALALVRHAKVHFHLETAQHGLIHLQSFGIKV